MQMRKTYNRLTSLLLAVSMAMTLHGQTSEGGDKKDDTMTTNSIRLTIGGKTTFTATLEDNPSARALTDLLAKGDLTIRMEDYADMEKVGPLGCRLPRCDRQTTTKAGDIILYQGQYLVIYYDTNAWSLTRLGTIDNADQAQLKSALGKGDVTVTISLDR